MAKKHSDKQMLRDFFRTALADLKTAAPACRHFGECGGCEFQDIPYAAQLACKQKAFQFILDTVAAGYRERAPGVEDAGEQAALIERADRLVAAFSGMLPDIVASPKPLGYRQRMDYVFAFGQAGLRRANRHRQVVPVAECPLLGDPGFTVFQKAKALAQEKNLESYDYLRHTGDLRYFVVRQSRNGQTLLSLVTKTRTNAQSVMNILEQLHADGVVTSGHWLLAEGLGDVSFGIPCGNAGEPHIEETGNGVTLSIGPNSFFQSNPAVAEIAYRAIAGFVPENARILDLYSGVASITLNLAGKAAAVTAVENVPDNLALAELNRKLNNADNVTLVDADSAEYLKRLADDPDAARPDMLIVNPPRPGVEKNGMRDIKRLSPDRIAYLSCNPFTLLRDLSDILDDYTVESVTLYDMFPQTRHFESLVLLEKRSLYTACDPKLRKWGLGVAPFHIHFP